MRLRRGADLMSSTRAACLGLLTIDQFCDRFAISRRSFYEEVAGGRLTAVKRGSRTLIRTDEAQRWCDALPKCEVPKSKRM